MQHQTPERFQTGLARQTRHFFMIAALSLVVAGIVARSLMVCFPRPEAGSSLRFPAAFIASSLLLLLGSTSLERALGYVRFERQAEFRRWLLMGLVSGTCFMGVQTFALWSMFPEHRNPEDASLESTAFALALAALHGLHFLVAVLFVSWITARTWAGRYDHEYHWGVRYCAWFWHALGIIWLAILFLFLIASH